MPNSLLNATEITRESLRVLHQSFTFLKNINRDYDDRFANGGASVSGKIGPTLQIRQPVQFTVRTGNTISIQDVIEPKTDLTVSTLKGVDWEFSDVDLALTIDRFSERYLQPAMARLGSEIEGDALSMFQQVSSQVGTPGTTPTYDTYLAAAQKLDEGLAPRDMKRYQLINPLANRTVVNELKGLFHSSSQIEDQYEEGTMGMTGGFKFFMSTNVRTHTVGPLGGTPLVNGAAQGITTGYAATTSLITDGWTAAASLRLRKGDIFTLAGVNSVNPESKITTGQLQQFVVTADASSDGAGNLTAIISPAIITGGAYQTVTGSPADNAVITVVGTANATYPINLAFHRDAFTLVTADLEVPKGMDMASREMFEGVSLRFVRGFDITNNKRICRFDLLYGYAAIRQQWGVRVIG